jgi:sialate O-acetylesterase
MESSRRGFKPLPRSIIRTIRRLKRTARKRIISIMRNLPLVLLSCIAFSTASANVSLPRIMGDGAILQRGVVIPIRGHADPGEKVSVAFAGKTASAVADKDGRWAMSFPAMSAGGPYEIVVTGNNTVTVRDVLVGDVWLCSGQSNMELPMFRMRVRYAEIVADSKDTNIREFLVPDVYDFNGPKDDLPSGSWTSADPNTVLNFSAVGYFFARELHAQTGVAIGIVNASLGGAPIEAFMSEKSLAAYPDSLAEGKRFRDAALVKETEAQNTAVEKKWAETIDSLDAGLNAKPAWFEEKIDESAWKIAPVPCTFRDIAADDPGIVWFRKSVDIPAGLAGQPARLNLGTIVQADVAYVNGVKVGGTPYQYPPRRYDVPAGVLHAGPNTIAVRVIATARDGEFIREKPYEIVIGDTHFDLKGAWKFNVGVKTDPKPATVFVRWKPMGLYNAMIEPLAATPIKGMVWYQGESNTYEAPLYGGMLKAMIADWRALFGANTPFIIAQLPNLGVGTTEPTESGWATMRNEQRKALALPFTGMAVTYDLGEWNDIHPENKLDVGSRLARAALDIAYGKNVPATGPLVKSMTLEGSRAVISFEDCCQLVSVGGGELHQFTIAGSDGVYHKAHAVLRGNQAIVWSRDVTEPKSVRYAWADNPVGANLYDAAGLPASTFEIKPAE